MFVRVCTAVAITTVPVVLGRVIVLSCVGSVTVSVVSKASGVAPSKIILASKPGTPVNVGLEIVGDVRVLLVRVWVSVVPTTAPVAPCTPVDASIWALASR